MTAIPRVTVFVIGLLAAAVANAALTPQCRTSGTATLQPNRPLLIVSVAAYPQVVIQCFAYTIEGQGCTADGTALEMYWEAASGRSAPRTFPISGLLGGSVVALAFNVRDAARWSLYVKNTAACAVTMPMSFTISAGGVGSMQLFTPYMTQMRPFVAHRAESLALAFVRPADAAGPADALVPLMAPASCSDVNFTSSLVTAAASSVTAAGDVLQTWSATFPTAGPYVLCYRAPSATAFVAVAALQVYGGNPAYFIINDGESNPYLQANVPFSISFVGDGLNATADSVRVLPSSRSCDQADASIAVSALRSVPALSQFAISVAVSATVAAEGNFRVCYRVAGGPWLVISWFGHFPQAALQNATTRPNTVQLLVDNATVAYNLVTTLSAILEVPASAIVIESRVAGQGAHVVCTVSVRCPSYQCDSNERTAFLRQLLSDGSAQLAAAGIHAASGSDGDDGGASIHIIAVDAGFLDTELGRTVVISVCGALAVVLAAGFGVFVWRRHAAREPVIGVPVPAATEAARLEMASPTAKEACA